MLSTAPKQVDLIEKWFRITAKYISVQPHITAKCRQSCPRCNAKKRFVVSALSVLDALLLRTYVTKRCCYWLLLHTVQCGQFRYRIDPPFLPMSSSMACHAVRSQCTQQEASKGDGEVNPQFAKAGLEKQRRRSQ